MVKDSQGNIIKDTISNNELCVLLELIYRLFHETNKKGKKIEAATEKAKASYDAKEHKAHIFGEHVQAYYELLKKTPDAFKRQFSGWEAALKKSGAAKISDVYAKAHEQIRKSPASVAKKAKAYKPKVVQAGHTLILQDKNGKKWLRQHKIGHKVRKERVAKKLSALFWSWSPLF